MGACQLKGPMKIKECFGSWRLINRVSLLGGACAALSLAPIACGQKKQPAAKADPDLRRAIAEKKALAKDLAAAETNPVPDEVWKFFDFAERNDIQGATNEFDRLQEKFIGYYSAPPPKGLWASVREALLGASRPATALNDALWCPVHESLGIVECFNEWDSQLLHQFGNDIISSIPTNSVYFGGTDPGRFVITALSESYRQGKPFFTITQNALADGRYLDYLRWMYGPKIYIPTATDSQSAFSNYMSDAQQRLRSGQLKPGEDVKIVNGRVQVSGQIAVMAINGLLVKTIFERNPGHEFYVEESFPLDWMYPYLSPHGLILKLNPEPLPELDESVCRKDHEYWWRYAAQFIGDWLTDETPVNQVCDFSDRVFLRKDFTGFNGNLAFVSNAEAQKSFSKLRSSIGGLYAWRRDHAGSEDAKGRMASEADYAFRQALALCPYSPEAVFRYVNLLLATGRTHDALLVAQTCQRLDPNNPQVIDLVEQLKKSQ